MVTKNSVLAILFATAGKGLKTRVKQIMGKPEGNGRAHDLATGVRHGIVRI